MVLPQALILELAALWVHAHVLCVGRAVRLAEGVANGDQRHRLFVVHGHARKRFADVMGGGDRIRLAVRPFGVHVD